MGLSRDNLTTIATRTGRKVVAAWSSRNAGAMGEVHGVVMHHTGSAWGTAIAPTLGIVQNGRSDLLNALCTYYIDRAGTIYLVTEKIAWHAGTGAWRGITDGNGHFLGIEAESDGKNWTAESVESFVRLVAEICRFLGVDPNTWAIRHAQWAPDRKIDFSGLDEADFRARVVARLANQEDDDMAFGEAERVTLNDILRELMAARRQELQPIMHTLGMDDPDKNGQDRLNDLYVQNDRNTAALLAAIGGGTGKIDAAALAAAIPDAIAEQVAAKLAERLSS